MEAPAPSTLLENRKIGEEVSSHMGRYHLLQSGGCWCAAGTPNSPPFHILIISPILLPTLHFSQPLCHSHSALSLYPPPKTRELQWSSSFTPCLWALLVPTPLKRLVTQASSGPRVWKLLIEDCLQPEWQIQGRFSVVIAVCCSCLCGGLRESVQLLGAKSRQQAMVITCHSSQRFLFLPWPSPAKS